jgi:DnaK suppressor protein
MGQTELQRFKLILQAMLETMEQPFRKRDEIAVENAPDSIDRVQQANERDLAIRQIEFNFNQVQNLKFALQRIADGSFGTCLRCDGYISLKRLEAVPWASFCIACQDVADSERAELDGEPSVRLTRMRDVA